MYVVHFARLAWSSFWLRYAPLGSPERSHYLRMYTSACRALNLEVYPQ